MIQQLASAGKGTAVTETWQIFDGFERAIHMTYDPRLALCIAALALFLLDIAVRKFKFKWQNGYSIGEGFAWWIKVANVEHIDWVTRETTFYVSFAAIMPPLIAASYDTDYRGDFTASAGAKKIIVGVYGRSWDAKVVEGGSWCTLDQSSKVTSTNGGENSIFVEAAANNTGASRTAIVRFTTTDGTNESFDFRVYQARY